MYRADEEIKYLHLISRDWINTSTAGVVVVEEHQLVLTLHHSSRETTSGVSAAAPVSHLLLYVYSKQLPLRGSEGLYVREQCFSH